MTPDDVTIENLHFPPTEENKRFWPEAREQAIKMMETSIGFPMLPEQAQFLAVGFFVAGYVARCSETYKHW